jgi:hypothetical protein
MKIRSLNSIILPSITRLREMAELLTVRVLWRCSFGRFNGVRVSWESRRSWLKPKAIDDYRSNDAAHPDFFNPSFRMRETNVLGLILSNSAAPPGP